MKKLLPIILTCGALIGSIVYYDTEKKNIQQESLCINDEFIEFYELLLLRSDLLETEKTAYRESYRTFLIWSNDEYREFDPNEYLIEE